MTRQPKPLDDNDSMLAWFGVELRNWRRERRLTQDALGLKVHVSGNYIGKIEKADRLCNPQLAAALDDALNAGGALRRLWDRVEKDLDQRRLESDKTRTSGEPLTAQTVVGGELPPPASAPRDRPLPPVERRSFLALGGVAVLAATSRMDRALPPLASTPLPTSVRLKDVEEVRLASTSFAKADNRAGGGGLARETAISQLRWAAGLLKVNRPPGLEGPLFTAVGRLATALGASAFDAYEHDEARALLEFGTACAEAGGDWHLRATSLNWRSRQATWCGAPDAGLTLAEHGLVRSDLLTHREQAMLHNARARALAKMERVQETLAAVGHSDDIFANARDDEDVVWMRYYDRAQHHGDTAHSLYDLALLTGRSPGCAAERFRIAIDEHAPRFVRSRAISGTKLASLTMATGDPVEAAAIAHRAMQDVGRVRSRRTADDVQELVNLAQAHREQPKVAELIERITTTVLS
ncbi:helix-turn-helix transcriptional regulator [Streptomyces sp. CA-249302]|uniref:helix-turn-helix transcriptional regulator n=1 Tax=Streptomyces sp. CA-249302 TaxID=3240058 RepID=UPI003D8B5796